MSISPEAVESLLQAISTIADAKSNKNNNYDQTVICVIKDNSCAEKQGYYTVSNGTASFKAYSEVTTYKIDQQVRVTIPNGDYGQKKYIEGLYAYSDENSITYVSPLDTFFDMATLTTTADGTPMQITEGLTANDSSRREVVIWQADLQDKKYSDLQQNNIYDMIGLQADFKCLLNNYKIRNGSYGLRLDLKIKLNSNNLYPLTHSLYLDSSQMFGNPYSFTVFSTQAKTYDISTLGTITGMNLVFYQSNDFTHYDGTNIAPLPIEVTNNIFVSDIYVAFGSNLINIADNTLKLYTSNETTFKYKPYKPGDDTNTKSLNFLWCNKDESGRFIGFSDGIYDPTYDEIAYLEAQKEDAALSGQMGQSNVPADKEGLEISSDLKQAKPLLKSIYKSIAEDLANTVKAFDTRLNDKVLVVDEWREAIPNWADKVQELGNYLIESVENALALAAAGTSSNTPTLFAQQLLAQINSCINTSQTYLTTIGIDVATNFPNYQGGYDSYKSRIESNLETIQNSRNSLLELIGDIEQRVSRYSRDDYVITPYLPRDFSESDNRYCVSWYRYEPGYYDETEPFMESEWRRLGPVQANAGAAAADIPQNLGLPGEGEPGYYAPKCGDGEGSLSVYLNPEMVEEKFKVVLFYNHKMFISNELVFTNLDDIPDFTTLALGAALSIEHGNKSMESYQTLYSSSNALINEADARIDRELKLTYDAAFGGDEKLLGMQVYWYLPIITTMLDYSPKKLNGFVAENEEDEENFDAKYHRDGYKYFYKKIETLDDLYFYYRIKDYYLPTSLRNTIFCLVETEDAIPMEVDISMIFGTQGTSGTDYTLLVTPANTMQTSVINEDPLELLIALYDYNNEQLPLLRSDVSLSWVGPTNYNAELLYNENDEVTGATITRIGNSYCGILKVLVPFTIPATETSESRIVDLITLYPVPWSNGEGYFIEGATTIIYNAAGGDPVYYKDPYKLFSQETNKEISEDIVWNISYYDVNGNIADIGLSQYMPIINYKSGLTPCTMYVADVDCYPVVYAMQGSIQLWAQPLMIIQNRYPSPMLNSWDGNLTIDEKNGTILSTMVGAGRKNVDNTFSGVLMGDIEGGAEMDLGDANQIDNTKLITNKSGLGLYGFHEGAQSFGFNVDGTAFIGKSGAGRISFNGNHGFIYSASWLQSFYEINEEGNLVWYNREGPFHYNGDTDTYTLNEGKSGMAIDLQNGHIDAYNFRLSAGNLYLNSNPTEEPNELDPRSNYYIQIGNDTTNGMLSLNQSGELVFKCTDFVLNAWNENKGLYLSSNAALNGYYVKVGNETNHIYFGNDLEIAVQNFLLDAWDDENNQGLWLWGSPVADNDYYLKLGNLNDTYITYTKSGELIINADTLYIGGSSVKDSLDGLNANLENLSKQDVLVGLLNGDGDAMYLVDSDNDGKSELYIKATAIATGIIQSQNWNGTFNDTNYNITSSGSAGMAISLYNGQIDSPNFKVSGEGNVVITGNLTATTLTANQGGFIAGWKINSTSLESPTYGYIGLFSDCPYQEAVCSADGEQISPVKDDWRILAGKTEDDGYPTFGLDKSGNLYASNVTLAGHITASTLIANVSGNIAGWTIDGNSLTNGVFGLYKNGGAHPYESNSTIVMGTTSTIQSVEKTDVVHEISSAWNRGPNVRTDEEYPFSYTFNLPSGGKNYKIYPLEQYNSWEESFTYHNTHGFLVPGSLNVSVNSTTGKVTVSMRFITDDPMVGNIQIDSMNLYYEAEYTIVVAPSISMPVFSVTKSGGLYASKGQLGPWQISSEGLVSDSYTLTPGGLKSFTGTITPWSDLYWDHQYIAALKPITSKGIDGKINIKSSVIIGSTTCQQCTIFMQSGIIYEIIGYDASGNELAKLTS